MIQRWNRAYEGVCYYATASVALTGMYSAAILAWVRRAVGRGFQQISAILDSRSERDCHHGCKQPCLCHQCCMWVSAALSALSLCLTCLEYKRFHLLFSGGGASAGTEHTLSSDGGRAWLNPDDKLFNMGLLQAHSIPAAQAGDGAERSKPGLQCSMG